MYATLLQRTGQTVGMLGLARLAARREDVVMTTAFLIHFGVSLRQVTNWHKSLQKNNTDKTGITFKWESTCFQVVLLAGHIFQTLIAATNTFPNQEPGSMPGASASQLVKPMETLHLSLIIPPMSSWQHYLLKFLTLGQVIWIWRVLGCGLMAHPGALKSGHQGNLITIMAHKILLQLTTMVWACGMMILKPILGLSFANMI